MDHEYLFFKGGGKREKKGVRGWRLGAPARQNRRASPECEYHSTLYRTAIFAVLNGSPLQSVHALLSPLSSLFSTRIMLYKVP